jgi:LuxR family maltose regulon positive regulatory protein
MVLDPTRRRLARPTLPRTALPFPVFESKLAIPEPRPGAVSRVGLVNRLRTERSRLVTVTAAAGYGKTTLLAQWAARDERPFAWVSLDGRDRDPIVLLRHVAAALDRLSPLERPLVVALNRPGPSVWSDAAPRLAAAIASCTRPFVLVLDGADALHGREACDLLSALADEVPDGSTLAVAGRAAPPLPVARLRAAGRVFELGTADLAFARREARPLLQAAGIELDEEGLGALFESTEGWAAGLSLAAAAMDGGESVVTGDDRLIAEYFTSEHLTDLPPEALAFLRRTSVLERLSGPLCDAVLETGGSADELRALEHANLFVRPLDRRGEWFRYHHLFRDVLRADLAQHEPDEVAGLHRRAMRWFRTHGELEPALAHAHAAGDGAREARLVEAAALRALRDGRASAVASWVEQLEGRVRVETYPAVAVLAGWLAVFGGRADDALEWLAAAERDGADRRCVAPGSVRAWRSLLRAAVCLDGIEPMLGHVDAALDGTRRDRPWVPLGLLLRGVAYFLQGEPAAAAVALALADDAAERAGATDVRALALAERSIVAAEAGEHRVSVETALAARELVERGPLADHPVAALVHAAAGRALLREGQWNDARTELAAAGPAAAMLTHAAPWLTVQTRLSLASAYVTLRDHERAVTELAAALEVLALRPQLGVLTQQAAELSSQIGELRDPVSSRSSGLTTAELRLLPLLATHLSFREIGLRLFVSRNTVKTQAISVYRKLSVSSRSEAIARACELGLLDDPADGRPVERAS